MWGEKTREKNSKQAEENVTTMMCVTGKKETQNKGSKAAREEIQTDR